MTCYYQAPANLKTKMAILNHSSKPAILKLLFSIRKPSTPSKKKND